VDAEGHLSISRGEIMKSILKCALGMAQAAVLPVILLGGVLAWTGCADSTPTTKLASNPEVTPPPAIGDNFGVEPEGSKYNISISKNSLEKEFLLQANIIQQIPAPMFENLKSRVVAFRKIEGLLYMLEATQGHTVTKDLPQALILTAFPITKETGERVYFDFDAGMAFLFTASGDWRASDMSGTEYNPAIEFAAMGKAWSYLKNAKIDEANNEFVIEQMAQVPELGLLTAEVRYYLKPYRPSEKFVPTRTTNFERMGFFEVAPLMMEGGSTLVHATKFNIEKPLVYAISANTPADFKQAVKDGVLYWNKVFGREVIQVIDAPEGVTAPARDFNIVQWINWDQAGMAYADAQMDPRTGETLHAQVYQTSAFAFSGKMKVLALMRKLQEEKDNPVKKYRLGLKGMSNESRCHIDHSSELLQTLSKALRADVSDDMILKMSQDYVREVVAHEVGHTLGLRHNFAGNLAANYSLKDRANLINTYMETGRAPEGVITTSSVMEYQVFEESAFTGDQIARGEAAYAYDVAAIKALYEGKKTPASEMPLFCTDSHAAMGMIDCARFDYGSSVVEFTQSWVKDALAIEPNELLEAFVAAKVPLPGLEETKLSEMKMTFAAKVERILNARSGARSLVVSAMSNKAQVLSVRRQFEKVDVLNEAEVKKAELDYVQSEIEKVGGMEAVLFKIPDTYAVDSLVKFNELLDSAIYQKGERFPGASFEFTSEDIAVMKQIAKPYFEKLQEELIKRDLLIAGDPLLKVENHPVGELFGNWAGERVKHYLFSLDQTGKDVLKYRILDGKCDDVETPCEVVDLPNFAFSADVRALAGRLVNSSRGKLPSWGLKASLQYRTEAKALSLFMMKVKSSLQKDLASVANTKDPQSSPVWTILNWVTTEAAPSEASYNPWP